MLVFFFSVAGVVPCQKRGLSKTKFWFAFQRVPPFSRTAVVEMVLSKKQRQAGLIYIKKQGEDGRGRRKLGSLLRKIKEFTLSCWMAVLPSFHSFFQEKTTVFYFLKGGNQGVLWLKGPCYLSSSALYLLVKSILFVVSCCYEKVKY